jgi:hypothetical protein
MGGIWGGMVNIMFEGLQKQEQKYNQSYFTWNGFINYLEIII